MRRRWFLALLLLVPSVSALEVADARGDVVLEAGSESVAADHEATDLLGFGFGNETVDAFDVWVEKAAWESSGSVVSCFGSASATSLGFRFAGMGYAIAMGEGATLFVRNDATGSYHSVGTAEISVDGPVRTATVPKHLVTGLDGLPARSGTAVEEVRAVSQAVQACEPAVTGTTARYLDVAPDGGPTAEAFHFTQDEGSFGQFTVSTPTPVRASNGGPDVFVYPMFVENAGAESTLIVATENVPDRWAVRAPVRVDLPAGGEATVPVVVSTPSQHTHGSKASFDLLFQDEDGSQVGRYSLGIRYLEVPQLAGHHPKIHVHAGVHQFTTFGGKDATWNSWFNTLAEFEEDSGLDIYAGPELEWHILMDPSLMMGLDFDTEGQGTAHLEFGHDYGGSYTFDLELLHCSPGATDGRYGSEFGCDRGSWLTLATGSQSELDIPMGSTQAVEVTLAPEPYSDLVPYITGANIMLYIQAEPPGIDPDVSEGPFLVSRTSHVELPLNEFQDPVEASLAEGTVVALTASASEVRVNPGDAAWVEFQVAVDAPRELSVELVGHHADWATAHPSRLRVDEGGRFAVQVTAPEAATAGEFAELFVIVEDAKDPTASAVTKLRAVVALEPLNEEQRGSELATPQRASPGAGVLFSIALLVGWVGLHRRF